MDEASFNTDVRGFLNAQGWCAKWPDPPKEVVFKSSPRPFDGTAYLKTLVLNYESKFMKGYQAFSFSRVEEHQWENLLRIKKTFDDGPVPHLELIILGIWEARKYEHAFLFEASLLHSLMESGKKSILKKELEALRDKGLCFNILGKNSEGLPEAEILRRTITTWSM